MKKPPVDTDLCPNCKAPVTVPKSTRSFICRSCDAVIKVALADEGVELKVVGRSVEEDPTYQALESNVAALKAQLDDLHARYLAEMARDYGNGGTSLRNVGVLAVVVGLVALVWSPAAGAIAAAAGLVATGIGIAVNSSRKRAKQAAARELSDAITRIGAQRDLLQRKAARLKTQV